MKQLFDEVSAGCSKLTTRSYSTSFSLGIRFLDTEFRGPIYAVYGFVRFADEIVDTFHDYDKKYLLDKFIADTYDALEKKISLNPILNAFQHAVNKYGIDLELIDTFMDSMRMDLGEISYDQEMYKKYILGSAEVVGLMCLKIFVNGDPQAYERLKPYAMKLGSAFQKVNFLRDAKDDLMGLGRNYFPDVDLQNFTSEGKALIEADIEAEFNEALQGIRMLPSGSRRGVYLAYYYYLKLFEKIRKSRAETVMKQRIRISNPSKVYLLFRSYLRHQLNML
jgi:phytoene/squalene synthetase